MIILTGILLWPIMEYLLHRFVGHEWKVNTLFKREHRKHHAVKDFFAPTLYKLIAAVIVVSLITLATRSLLFATSFTLMYLFYEWTHYSIHKFKPRTEWGRRMRAHHLHHHFENARTNFGVTNTIFDHVFKTAAKSKPSSTAKWSY